MNAIAFAATIGGTVVAVAGVWFGWLQSKGERHQAVVLAGKQHEHERKMARGERLFDARAVAYQELLRMLYRAMTTIDRTEPIITTTPPPVPPPRPTDEEWDEMMAKVAVFGSQELVEAFEHFVSKANGFHVWAATFKAIKNQQADIADTAEQMNKHRQEARDALKAIERLMREELSGL